MVNKKRIEDEIKEIKFLIDNDMLDLAEEKLKTKEKELMEI